ncbi:hypothetical protein H0H81_010074 [Sphagnurus paluster]|uniref:Uncharacterized protein n=1 Tax=Sphagnurus paluster TaxID=117069 RepID=A0A9P7FVY4_9AGAR|nr:hypothetical protein H0H81_010074 [Sphagnurus paluster]
MKERTAMSDLRANADGQALALVMRMSIMVLPHAQISTLSESLTAQCGPWEWVQFLSQSPLAMSLPNPLTFLPHPFTEELTFTAQSLTQRLITPSTDPGPADNPAQATAAAEFGAFFNFAKGKVCFPLRCDVKITKEEEEGAKPYTKIRRLFAPLRHLRSLKHRRLDHLKEQKAEFGDLIAKRIPRAPTRTVYGIRPYMYGSFTGGSRPQKCKLAAIKAAHEIAARVSHLPPVG